MSATLGSQSRTYSASEVMCTVVIVFSENTVPRTIHAVCKQKTTTATFNNAATHHVQGSCVLNMQPQFAH
jgi:hypothetical protein